MAKSDSIWYSRLSSYWAFHVSAWTLEEIMWLNPLSILLALRLFLQTTLHHCLGPYQEKQETFFHISSLASPMLPTALPLLPPFITCDPFWYVGLPTEKRTVWSYPQEVVLFGNGYPQTVCVTHRKSLCLSVTHRKLFFLKVSHRKI